MCSSDLPHPFSLSLCSIRKIADMYSAEGYYTIVPRMLHPNMQGSGETDGKGEKNILLLLE